MIIKWPLLLIESVLASVNLISCNSDARGQDNVYAEPKVIFFLTVWALKTHSRDFKYIGNPTWPNLQDAQYNCVFQLSLDITSGLEAIVLQFPDFQTDCTQRSRVWITEYGKQQAFHYCGRNAINNYI